MTFNVQTCDAIEVIIKLTERCNINCDYCYMFNRGNEDYKHRPAQISEQTIRQIVAFVAQGVSDLAAKRVNVVLHGGEPLMMKRNKFRLLCEELRGGLADDVDLTIGIQTNAMLVDDAWIDIFSDCDVHVGISLDGPERINDVHRVDKRGRGTYKRVLAGIELLKVAYNNERIRKPGIVCVINPEFSAQEVYNHIVKELGFTHISFNLPMETNESMPPGMADRYARYLVELFRTWSSDDNPAIKVRILDQMLRVFSGDKRLRDQIANYITRHVMVVIASDGDLSEHDDFKVINFAQRGGNIRNTTLHEFANSPLRKYLHHLSHAMPDACRTCDWRNYCRAGVTHGLTVSRYSQDGGFNNASSFCKAFSSLFEEGAMYLLKNGLPYDALEDALNLGESGAGGMTSVEVIPEKLFSVEFL